MKYPRKKSSGNVKLSEKNYMKRTFGDDKALRVIIKAKAIYLVSGDDDLLSLGYVGGCKIMTAHQFEHEWKNNNE